MRRSTSGASRRANASSSTSKPFWGTRAAEGPGCARPLTQEAELAGHVPGPAWYLVVLGAYDRHVAVAARRPRLSARQDGHEVAARAERLDQDARLLLDASDLAVARAEEGDPHRSPLSARAAPVPSAVQSWAWRLLHCASSILHCLHGWTDP